MSSLRFIGQLTCGATLGMLVACAADDKRPVGANCDSDAQCEQGLCGGGVCLDPNGDEDGDSDQQASDERTVTPVGGGDFRLWNEGTTLFIECPDKTVIQPERGYDFARCAGLTFGCQVLTGSSCTADNDCAGGQVCCRFGTEQAFTDVCSPADKCNE